MPVAAIGEEKPAERHHARCPPEGHRRQGQQLFQRHPHGAGKLPADEFRQPPHEGQVLLCSARAASASTTPARRGRSSSPMANILRSRISTSTPRIGSNWIRPRSGSSCSSDVNLIRDAQIMEVQQSDDLIVVALQDKNPDAGGQITLFLATKPDLELKAWSTKDAAGHRNPGRSLGSGQRRRVRRRTVQDRASWLGRVRWTLRSPSSSLRRAPLHAGSKEESHEVAVRTSHRRRGCNGLGRVCALHAFSAPTKLPFVGFHPSSLRGA